MFVDEAIVELYAGYGGNGCKAFRREKGVPLGGPFGGNGGKGSNIIFEATTDLNTLIDYRYKRIIKGENGENGMGKGKYGKNAEDIILKVPLGTIVKDTSTNEVLADLTKEKQTVIAAKGGRGGRGNIALATHSNPAPDLAENGEPGEYKKIKLELKLIADVGLVGMPSVGKSTFISKVSKAKPKIADYPFTTLVPNLGIVKIDNKSFVLADLPGLIEGASEGKGLGERFLKHIERTKIIVHLIDMSGNLKDPYNDYVVINKELEKYSKKLIKKPQIVVANKMDIESSKENLKKFKEKVKVPVYEISAISNKGLEKVLYAIIDLLKKEENKKIETKENHVVYKYKEESPFKIEKKDNTWILSGKKIEKLLLMSRFDTDQAIYAFSKKLKNIGVDDELKRLGAKEGDDIKILDYSFEYKE